MSVKNLFCKFISDKLQHKIERNDKTFYFHFKILPPGREYQERFARNILPGFFLSGGFNLGDSYE